MAPHTNLAPLLIAAACVIGSAPAVLAQTKIEAKTWDDAIYKLDCKDIKKNADGSFSITAVVKVRLIGIKGSLSRIWIRLWRICGQSHPKRHRDNS